MNDILYDLKFSELTDSLDLGKLVGQPKQIYGGFLHHMYKVKTSKSDYAIKALNPKIMKRKQAMSNYLFSEKVARIALENGLSAVPALVENGNPVHKIDSQYYLVFPWIEAKPIDATKVDVERCKIIGNILGRLHTIDFSSIYGENMEQISFVNIEWDKMIAVNDIDDLKLKQLLEDKKQILKEIYVRTFSSSEKLQNTLVISHRDLDPKNVLWDGYNPIIIDWEVAGYINPGIELFQVALYWSSINGVTPDKNMFQSFITAYIDAGGKQIENLEDAMYSMMRSQLGWLEYNLRLSKGVESNTTEEKSVGVGESLRAIESIIELYELIPTMICWVKEKVDC